MATTLPSPGRVAGAISLRLKFVIALVGVLALSLIFRGYVREHALPIFQRLATAFIHGRLDVGFPMYDSAPSNGRYYVPLGPLPAILMMPLVAIGGLVGLELWLELGSIALTVPAIIAIFKELGIDSRSDRALLGLATVAGTSYLSAAVVNSSYYIASLVVVVLMAWALVLALRGKWPFLAGIMVGLAGMTRAPAVFAVIPVAALYASRRPAVRGRAIAAVIAGVLPSLLLLALYNRTRFGSPFESGYGLQTLLAPPLRAARVQGIFSLAHLPKNLYYFLLAVPAPVGGESAPVMRFPFVSPSDWGTGLLWLSPWMFWALLARGRRATVLALGAVVILLPSLFYYGIGWIQFGYRYALDALPFMAALAALGWQRVGHDRLFRAAIAYSVIVNVLGASWLISRLG